MKSTLIRYHLFNTIADSLLTLWQKVVQWRGTGLPVPSPTERQRIEEEIVHPISELHHPLTSATNHQQLQRWLDKGYATPSEYDEAWWNEFEDTLRANRLTLSESE